MKLLTVGIVVCVVLACAYASLRAGEKSAKKAFVIPEAKQPKGFPKPGRVGEIIVKQYPAYRAARVSNDSMRQNAMFGELFRENTSAVRLCHPRVFSRQPALPILQNAADHAAHCGIDSLQIGVAVIHRRPTCRIHHLTKVV